EGVVALAVLSGLVLIVLVLAFVRAWISATPAAFSDRCGLSPATDAEGIVAARRDRLLMLGAAGALLRPIVQLTIIGGVGANSAVASVLWIVLAMTTLALAAGLLSLWRRARQPLLLAACFCLFADAILAPLSFHRYVLLIMLGVEGITWTLFGV